MKKSKILAAGLIGLLMKEQKIKWFIALMFITVISFHSYAQDNISLVSMGVLGIAQLPTISVDGQKVNQRTDIVTLPYDMRKNTFLKINLGEHTISMGILSDVYVSEVFIFRPGKYYVAEYKSKKISFIDVTDEVLSGIGKNNEWGWYDTFIIVEKKFGITRLSNGIGRARAPTGKSYYNYGVHNFQDGTSEYSTVRIYAKDGTLVVKKFNNEDVGWTSGGRDSNVVVIPSGKQRLVLDYYAPRSKSDPAGGLVGVGVQIGEMIKRGKADERDTFDIIIDYEFFSGAEYEIKFEKSKVKNGPYAEVEVTPEKGSPKGQRPGRGVGSSKADVVAAVAAEEAAKTAEAAAREAAKLQIRYNVVIDGKQAGPYSYDELRQLASKGNISKNTFVWKEGMPQWVAAGTVDELTDIWSSVPPPLPPPLR